MEPKSSSEKRFLQKLIEVIDANLQNEDFGVNELAAELGMNRVTLHRKVKSVVKKSVSVFIRETRLNRALELLLQQAGTVSEIAFRVGFGSVSYFNRCFHEFYGYPPGEILKGLHESPLEVSSAKVSKKSWKSILWIAAPILALILVFIYFSSQNNRDPENEKRIAVLPFVNNSPDTEQNLAKKKNKKLRDYLPKTKLPIICICKA